MHSHDKIKTPLRVLPENRSPINKTQLMGTENLQQPEKTEEAKKMSSAELEKAPQLKAYIKYPKYDFF